MTNFLIYYFFIFSLICITLPLQAIISILIVFMSGFPAIFKQLRIGKNGKPFILYKFRTMKIGAEKIKRKLLRLNEADGPVFKIHNDPRYTPIGRFLSHTGLDELPQLWNVLKGDMALIGPRPLPVEEAGKLTQWQRKRQSIKPGIISPWILEGYHTKPFTEWMKSDIEYAKRKSILHDIAFSFRMIPYLIQLLFREIL